ncbi:MAG: penicillin acylase family protein [Myxococcota bacterium]|nr:penicillin acylase family protein [Myxococcota bacterium]
MRFLLVTLAVAAGLGAVALQLMGDRERRRAFPPVEGRIPVAGLDRGVEVVRDERGVPHVFAGSAADAWRGLGFVHAQDRLAQMARFRRSARGELAATEGPDALPGDRLARTLGFARRAEADLAALPERTRGVLAAYAAGVNGHLAWLRDGGGEPPLGLGGIPADWSPADSLALFRQYAWAAGATHEESLVLSELLARFGGLEARLFFPRTLGLEALGEKRPDLVHRSLRRSVPAPLRQRLGLAGASVGSSAFVVHGSAARFGALLASDSHQAPTAPALWHQAHLEGPGMDVAGATLPGVPAFWSGFNGRLVWGATHLPAVATDLLEETLGDDGGTALSEREETIEVLGQQTIRHRVRESRRGPIVSDVLAPDGPLLSLRWAGFEDRAGPTGLLDLAAARDVAEARRALGRHEAPVLEIALLDDAGAGGTQVAGFVPARQLPSGGVPIPARGRAYRWAGRLPAESLPWQPVSANRPFAIAADALPAGWRQARMELFWRVGTRAGRIATRLEAAAGEGGVRLQDLAAIQADVAAPGARALVDEALGLIDASALPAEGRAAAELLAAWPGENGADSAGAAAFHLFFEQLLRRLLEPRLGEDLLDRYRRLRGVSTTDLVLRLLRDAADGGELPGGWAEPEAVREAIRLSLRDAWIRGGVQLGSNRSKWRWGELHPLRFRPLLPDAWGRGLSVLGPFPFGGDGDSVAVAAFHGREGFETRIAPVFRLAAEQGELSQGLTHLVPGQVEHPGHPHAADEIEAWLAARPRLLTASRAVVEDRPSRRLRLEPAP